MATVKYSGPIASFHCPTNAEIRSLKVHFSPKQEGSGDPSPENVRPIVGWDGVSVHNDDVVGVPNVSDTVAVDWSEDIGTVYGGWVDLITGEVCEKYIAKDMGQINWNKSSSGNKFYIIGLSSNYPWRSDLIMYCPIYKFDGPNIGSDWYGDDCTIRYYYQLTGNSREIYIHDERYDNAQDFKTAMDGIVLVYPIATPNTYHLAPTELQTFLGKNNVWSNADYVEIEYDLHEMQTLLQRKAFIMANQPHIESASGAIASFNTDLRAPLKECKVHFSPVQDLHGYSNPWPAGGGKNIAKPYDNSYVSSTYISFDYSAANGTFRCYGTASASSTHSSPSATNAVNNGATFTLPAGTYTLSIIDGDGANIYAQCVSSTETVLAETTSYTTFTTNESLTAFVRLKVAAAATVDKTVKIQLEKGSSATSYVPYENVCAISGWTGVEVYQSGVDTSNFTTLPIDWTTEAGTIYGGYVDLVSGEVWKTHHKIVADGVNVKANSDYTNVNANRFGAGIVYLNPIGDYCHNLADIVNCVKCDILPINPTGYQAPDNIDYASATSAGRQYIVFYVGNISEHPEITTKQQKIDFTNAWLQEHPATIVYRLATPTLITPLTPTQLKSLRGTNNIWSNANGDIKLKYWSH